MDSTTTNAAGTRKNRHGGSIRVFPTDGGTGHRVTTGIHHRTEVKRKLEASYRAQWTKEMKIQLEQDQARRLEIVQELNVAQQKAQPDIERRRESLETKIHRSLKDRAIAAQGMLNTIDDGDMTRLQRSQRARDAVGSGDPDQILVTILAHLTAISGQEKKEFQEKFEAIKSFLRSAAAASLAESKTSKVAVAPKATGLVARTSYPLPFISDDDEGEDDA